MLQQGGFLDDALRQRAELDRLEGPLTQTTAAIQRLARELDDFGGLTGKQAGDWLSFRRRLVLIAALASRAARDLGLETAADAIVKDIPF